MQVTVRECHPQKIQCMLGALQSAFREPAFLHKGGDALSKMYLTTFTTFHWSFSHKLHTPSMISSRYSSIIHPVSSSTETRKTPPKPRRHRLIPFHCTHTHHCSQTCRPLPSAIAFATFFSQLGAAARQFPSTFAFKILPWSFSRLRCWIERDRALFPTREEIMPILLAQ